MIKMKQINQISRMNNEMILSPERGGMTPNIVLTTVGVLVKSTEKLTVDNFNILFDEVIKLYKSSCWSLGDTLILSEEHWGTGAAVTKYQEAMQATGYSRSTLRDMVLTCRRFPIEKRSAKLSFSHHREIALANVAPPLRCELLHMAEEENLSCKLLREKIRSYCIKIGQGKEVNKNVKSVLGIEIPEEVLDTDSDSFPKWEAQCIKEWMRKQRSNKYKVKQCDIARDFFASCDKFYREILMFHPAQ